MRNPNAELRSGRRSRHPYCPARQGGVGLRFLGATADAGQLQGRVTADLAMNLLEAEYRLGRRSTAVAWPPVAAHSLLGRVLRLRRSCLGSLRGIDTRDRANT